MSDSLLRFIISVPSIDDEYDLKLDRYLRDKPYQHFQRLSPQGTPIRVIIIHRISFELLDKIKADFLGMYRGHKHANLCTFEQFSENNYQV